MTDRFVKAERRAERWLMQQKATFERWASRSKSTDCRLHIQRKVLCGVTVWLDLWAVSTEHGENVKIASVTINNSGGNNIHTKIKLHVDMRLTWED